MMVKENINPSCNLCGKQMLTGGVKQEPLKKQRIKSIDLLKLFAIYLVVYAHSLMDFTSTEMENNLVALHSLIYAFHMPLFMIVSGFFAESSMALNVKDFLLKKSMLLLPWIGWGTILLIVTIPLANYDGENFAPAFSAEWIKFGYLKGHFWFLKALFACYLFRYVGRRLSNNVWIAFFIGFILSRITKESQIPVMYLYFVIGGIIHKYWNSIMEHRVMVMVASLITFMVMFSVKHNIPYNTVNILGLLHGEEYQLMDILKEVYVEFRGVVGSLFFICLFSYVDKFSPNRYIDKFAEWGKYTLGVYVMQIIIVETLMKEFININGISPYVYVFIIVPLMSIVVVAFCIWASKMLERNSLTAMIFLGIKMK